MTTQCKGGTDRRQLEVVRVWRENRCLRESTITAYLQWFRRFKDYCREQQLEENSQLTRGKISDFAKVYAQTRNIDRDYTTHNACCALRAWALALGTTGNAVSRWEAPSRPKRFCSPLLDEFVQHLQRHRGNTARTIRKKIDHIVSLEAFLRSRRSRLTRVRLCDIDAFVVGCGSRYARTTVADICCSVREFLRFLHASGRLSINLAPSVAAPIVRRGERLPRALPWDDVQRILRAVDRSIPCGQRDYAMLLLMSTYGLGAGEVIHLTLDDIDWRTGTIRVVRPKTGMEVLLPLLPAVARALASYLRRGRPTHAPTRHLFLGTKAPHVRLSGSSAVRYVLVKHAHAAGVWAPYLGSHVLRHTHACRQMEQGTRPKVISDILGHRRPESTSAYIRISTQRLRELSLPVPS